MSSLNSGVTVWLWTGVDAAGNIGDVITYEWSSAACSISPAVQSTRVTSIRLHSISHGEAAVVFVTAASDAGDGKMPTAVPGLQFEYQLDDSGVWIRTTDALVMITVSIGAQHT
jgi:hypothetical protein